MVSIDNKNIKLKGSPVSNISKCFHFINNRPNERVDHGVDMLKYSERKHM